MQITHAFSNTIADATGTLIIWSGSSTVTAPATAMVRPSNWNDEHALAFVVNGNTLGASSGSGTNLSLAASGPLSVGLSGSDILFSAAPLETITYYEPMPIGNNTSYSSHGQNTLYAQPVLPVDYVSFDSIQFTVSMSSASSSVSHSVGETIRYGLYSKLTDPSSNSYTLVASNSMVIKASYSSNLSGGLTVSDSSAGYTVSSAGTVFGSVLSGPKRMNLALRGTMEPGGEYLLAFAVSTESVGNTGALRLSVLQATGMTNGSFGVIARNTVGITSNNMTDKSALWRFSATTGALPNSIPATQLSADSVHRLHFRLVAS